MNSHQKHQTLVNEYQESAQTVQRFKMYGIAFQIGVWVLLFCLKTLHVGHLYGYATIIFGLLLLMRVRDFKLRRALDLNMTRATLEGLKLEKQNPRLGDFFQDALKNFGIFRVMLQRALLDVGVLCFFGFALFRLILDINPDFTISRGVAYPILGFLGFFIGDLYYKPLKALVDAKREVFSNCT